MDELNQTPDDSEQLSQPVALPATGRIDYIDVAKNMRYSPVRDLAYCFPRQMAAVAQNFANRRWPELEDALCKIDSCDLATGEVNVGRVFEILTEMMYSAADAAKTNEKLADRMREAGFSELPPGARIAVFAMLGSVVFGQFFNGLRDITPMGEIPPSTIKVHCQEIVEAARQMGSGLIPEVEQAANDVREATRAARQSGLTFEEIIQCVQQCRLG